MITVKGWTYKIKPFDDRNSSVSRNLARSNACSKIMPLLEADREYRILLTEEVEFDDLGYFSWVTTITAEEEK